MNYNLHTINSHVILDHRCYLPAICNALNQGMANELCRIAFQNFGSVATSNEAWRVWRQRSFFKGWFLFNQSFWPEQAWFQICLWSGNNLSHSLLNFIPIKLELAEALWWSNESFSYICVQALLSTHQIWYNRCLSGAGCWKGNFWRSKKCFFFVQETETFSFTFLFRIAEPGWMKPWILLAEGLLPRPAPEASGCHCAGLPKKLKSL